MNLNDLQSSLKVDFTNEFKHSKPFSKNSFLSAILNTVAGGLNDMYTRLNYLVLQVFADTADYKYLKLQAQNRIPIRPTNKSKGKVCVNGVVGAILPINTVLGGYHTLAGSTILNREISTINTASLINGLLELVFAEPHQLISNTEIIISNSTALNGTHKILVTSAKSITCIVAKADTSETNITINSNSVIVEVEALKVGKEFNTQPLTILTPIVNIVGIDEIAVIHNGLTGGRGEETEEEYRTRFLAYLREPQSAFTTNFIKALVMLKHPNVTRFYSYLDNGFINFIVVNDEVEDYDLLADELIEIRDLILTHLPINIDANSILVSNAVKELIELEISNTLPNDNNLHVAIIESIDALFLDNLLGKTIDINILKGVIYGTVDLRSIRSVNSYDININTNINIPNNSLAILKIKVS